LELARERDRRAMEAWRDHPYVDIIDNRADFDTKINKLIDLVVRRIGINVGDRSLHFFDTFDVNGSLVSGCGGVRDGGRGHVMGL
jgi:hypothetical protein